MPETIMIVAGETSGELYGALLATSLRQKRPGVRIIGVGGERMREAGVELISGISSAFGLTEALSALKKIKDTFRKATEALQIYKPRVLVLIDYPDFNLKLAEKAKGYGIKILYYVSPQVWAWRKKRIFKIAGLINKMAVILPFEEKIYKEIGVDCEFVGHPVYDEIQDMKRDKNGLKAELGLQKDIPLLSLLPGSRPHELDRLLPLMLEITKEFRKKFSGFQFCIPLAPNTDLSKYSRLIDHLKEEGIVVNQGRSLEALAASDYAVIASGTATLQAVLLGVPIVVVYKLFPLTYWLARLILSVKHASLVNVLSGREVVKEFFQRDASVFNVVNELSRIMNDKMYFNIMIDAYEKVKMIYSDKRASERVADMVIQLSGWNK